MKERYNRMHELEQRKTALEKQKKLLGTLAEQRAAAKAEAVDDVFSKAEAQFGHLVTETTATMNDPELQELLTQFIEVYGKKRNRVTYRSKGFLRGREKIETPLPTKVEKKYPEIVVNRDGKNFNLNWGKIQFETIEGRVYFSFSKQSIDVMLVLPAAYYSGRHSLPELKDYLVDAIANLTVYGKETNVGEVLQLEYNYDDSYRPHDDDE